MRHADLCCALLAFVFGLSCVDPVSAARPNVIVILVDDMGFSDIGCYGGEIATPNLDALAANGVRFTQFYNTGRCCPTRASLLTGLYPHQAGVGHMTDAKRDAAGNVLPGYQGRLNEHCVTMGQVMQSAGYHTGMVGKWHVGHDAGVRPIDRGFVNSLNAAAGGFYYANTPKADLFFNGEKVSSLANSPVPADWYSTDLWTDFGLQFIDNALAADKPFFLYLAHNAPHFPLQAPQADIDRYRGKFKAGWDKLRDARYARQIDMGLIDASWPLTPRPEAIPAWDSLEPDVQDRYDHLMAIFAATLDRVDQSIGRLVDHLRATKQLDNTLILFMSDNGGNAEAGVPGRFVGDVLGDRNSTVFVGQCWAHLENTPFRLYKHYNHEGGIATPLVAHWPAGIPQDRRGQWERQPGHLIDIMATCVDVADATYPAELNGQAITPLEGVSLVPALAGRDLQRSNPLFFEHEGNAAIRRGDWKLVREGASGPWELFNLQTDRTEQVDLSGSQPQLVQELEAEWLAWADRAQVLNQTDAAAKPGAKRPGAKQGAGKGKAAPSRPNANRKQPAEALAE